jgi:hypothetical protein
MPEVSALKLFDVPGEFVISAPRQEESCTAQPHRLGFQVRFRERQRICDAWD